MPIVDDGGGGGTALGTVRRRVGVGIVTRRGRALTKKSALAGRVEVRIAGSICTREIVASIWGGGGGSSNKADDTTVAPSAEIFYCRSYQNVRSDSVARWCSCELVSVRARWRGAGDENGRHGPEQGGSGLIQSCGFAAGVRSSNRSAAKCFKRERNKGWPIIGRTCSDTPK